ncbi:MAG TPA: hypothetical protein VGC82_03015 [Rhodopila sp.]|jgi:hypothetical protein
MAYYMVRLYSGSGNRSPEQLCELAGRELAPQLMQAGGLQRYLTGITDDGKVVSASVYDSKAAAQKGLDTAREWVSKTDAMRGYQLSQTMQGEIVRVMQGNTQNRATHGVGRLHTTNATAERIADAIEQHGIPASQSIQGRARTLVVQLEDGRVGTFLAFDSQEGRDQHSQNVRNQRAELNPIKQVMPNEPEEINVRIVTSTSG